MTNESTVTTESTEEAEHAPIVVNGYQVAVDGDEPRVRDIDLGERLGYERPRVIRDLIERLINDKKMNDVHHCRTVRRWPGQVAAVPVTEYWLTEKQALKVVAKSETEIADAILDEVIDVFLEVQRHGRIGLGRGDAAALAQRIESLEEEHTLTRRMTRDLGATAHEHARRLSSAEGWIGQAKRRGRLGPDAQIGLFDPRPVSDDDIVEHLCDIERSLKRHLGRRERAEIMVSTVRRFCRAA